MQIGAQLRRLREERKMSRRDVGKKVGLHSGHITRVESGDIVPSLETLQRFAKALDVPLWELFYTGAQWQPPQYLTDLHGLAQARGKDGEDARFFLKLRPLLSRIREKDRGTFLSFAKGLATQSSNKPVF